MTTNPRKIAVIALISAEQGGYSNLVLDNLLKTNNLTTEDEALLSALFYGTIERLLTIHSILGLYSSHPVKKMKPEIRAILSVSVYQMLFMDKIPDSAAVNEAVKLVRAGKHKQLAGFSNAVLRSVARDKQIILNELSSTTDLSFKYSSTPSFALELIEQYGKEQTEEFLASSFCKPPVYVRKNTLISDSPVDESNYQPTDFEHCYTLKNVHQFLKGPDFRNGLYHVEDKACQIACNILDARPGDRVLDVCAAPGGKTFTLAQHMQNTGEIIACDLHPHRVNLIKQGADRLKITNVSAIENNAQIYNPRLGQFDKILCDIPCSGYGVIRRKPEIKLKNTEQFSELPEIQYQILETSSKYLKKGGFLLYSTCTVRNQENELVVKRFLDNHKDYKMVTARQLLPQTDGTDGFFYSLLTR